jgi:hypothetical protein
VGGKAFGGADRSGAAACRPGMKEGSSRVSTSRRPIDSTRTDSATQLALILTV